MKECKYFIKRVNTIRDLIACLYDLDDGNCCTGGLLHIVADDGNLEDHHIQFCLDECIKHSEREEAGLGKLICEELLKLSMEQRRLVYEPVWIVDAWCYQHNRHCDKCPIHNENESFW